MHDAQQPGTEECLIETAVGVTLVHIGLAWAVAGVLAVYGGLWIALAVPALGVLLWLAGRNRITTAAEAHRMSPLYRRSTLSPSHTA